VKHRSYFTSSIVFIVVTFAIWKGYEAIAPDFAIIGWLLFGSVAIFIPCLFALVLWGIWEYEHRLSEGKKPVVRRKKE
jgi:hypothetical protein